MVVVLVGAIIVFWILMLFGPRLDRGKASARHERPIVARLRQAAMEGERGTGGQKAAFFRGVEAMGKVMDRATPDDLDYLISTAERGEEKIHGFVLLQQLVMRGDRPRIVRLLSHVDWGSPGWGDLWHTDVEMRLAEQYPGTRRLEGLEVLLDAADAAAKGPIRDHLFERVRFTFGPVAVGGVSDDHLVATAREWLERHREEATINPEYASFMGHGGPVSSQFGTEFAEYMLQPSPRREPPGESRSP